MTGKEALAIFKGWELSNPFEKEEVDLNSVRYANSQLNQEYHNIIKTIEKELDKLTKYKRAFEILKEILSLNKDKSIDGKVDFYTLYFTGQFPYEIYKRLEKEEYELLEELMSDGKIN